MSTRPATPKVKAKSARKPRRSAGTDVLAPEDATETNGNRFAAWAAAHGLLSPLPDDGASKDKQRSIQSIEVGFRLIRCLEMAPRLLSLRELAAAAGMSGSKAHFYLVSFRKLGFVHRDEATGRYGLGPYAAQLGLVALNRMDAVALSKEPMQQLVARTGEAAFLSVWGNHGPCIVSKVDGPRFVPMVLRVGYTLPLIDTATGRVFLAFMPEEATAALVEKERGEKTARSHSATAAELGSIAAEVRAKGFARNDSVVNEGFVALSAPVFDHGGVICAALTLIGPSGLMNSDKSGLDGRALRETAAQISQLLGWRKSRAG